MKKRDPAENKMIRRQFRFSKAEFGKIKILAKLYANGNMARWIRYAALEAPRKKLPTLGRGK